MSLIKRLITSLSCTSNLCDSVSGASLLYLFINITILILFSMSWLFFKRNIMILYRDRHWKIWTAGGGSVMLWVMFCWETLSPGIHEECDKESKCCLGLQIHQISVQSSIHPWRPQLTTYSTNANTTGHLQRPCWDNVLRGQSCFGGTTGTYTILGRFSLVAD